MDITEILKEILSISMKYGIEITIEKEGKKNKILFDIHNKNLSILIPDPDDKNLINELNKILKELKDFFD